MTPFQQIPDGLVITLQKGIYRQTPLFQRAGNVYAKIGSGFIRLYKNGGTSVPSISWKEYDPGQAKIGEDSFALIIRTSTHIHKKAYPKAV
jgi:hypothetical protein